MIKIYKTQEEMNQEWYESMIETFDNIDLKVNIYDVHRFNIPEKDEYTLEDRKKIVGSLFEQGGKIMEIGVKVEVGKLIELEVGMG